MDTKYHMPCFNSGYSKAKTSCEIFVKDLKYILKQDEWARTKTELKCQKCQQIWNELFGKVKNDPVFSSGFSIM